MSSQIKATNSSFSGVINIDGATIQFGVANRKKWVSILTGVRDAGSSWKVWFGRYGVFQIRKGALGALDELIKKLFDAAAKLRAKVADSRQTKSQDVRDEKRQARGGNRQLYHNGRKEDKRTYPAWEAFKASRLAAAA